MKNETDTAIARNEAINSLALTKLEPT